MHDSDAGLANESPSGIQGTRATPSLVAAWRLRHRTGGPGRRGWCRNLPTGPPGPTARTAHGSRRRRQLGAGKGLEIIVGRGEPGSGLGPWPGPAGSLLPSSHGHGGQLAARPADYGPAAKGALTGLGLFILAHSTSIVLGLAYTSTQYKH